MSVCLSVSPAELFTHSAKPQSVSSDLFVFISQLPILTNLPRSLPPFPVLQSQQKCSLCFFYIHLIILTSWTLCSWFKQSYFEIRSRLKSGCPLSVLSFNRRYMTLLCDWEEAQWYDRVIETIAYHHIL